MHLISDKEILYCLRNHAQGIGLDGLIAELELPSDEKRVFAERLCQLQQKGFIDLVPNGGAAGEENDRFCISKEGEEWLRGSKKSQPFDRKAEVRYWVLTAIAVAALLLALFK